MDKQKVLDTFKLIVNKELKLNPLKVWTVNELITKINLSGITNLAKISCFNELGTILHIQKFFRIYKNHTNDVVTYIFVKSRRYK